MSGPMAWWYWFGMWIGAIASFFMCWWLFLEAFRRNAPIATFTWPIVSIGGFMLQLPALMIGGDLGGTSTIGAFFGIIGVMVTGVAAVTYFSTQSPTGSVWSLNTKDISSSSSVRERRRTSSSGPRASVPLPTPSKSAARQNEAQQLPQRPFSMDAAPQVERAPIRADRSIVAEPVMRAEEQEDEDAETLLDDGGNTFADNLQEEANVGPKHLVESGSASSEIAGTVIDEPDRTVVDEPGGTLLEDTPGAQLVILDGKTSQIVVTDRSGPFVVGRDPAHCNLAVDDPRVSRKHFSIDRVNGQYVIRDLDSGNGTFMNGEPLLEAETLKDGDVIEFGRTTATFGIG